MAPKDSELVFYGPHYEPDLNPKYNRDRHVVRSPSSVEDPVAKAKADRFRYWINIGLGTTALVITAILLGYFLSCGFEGCASETTPVSFRFLTSGSTGFTTSSSSAPGASASTFPQQNGGHSAHHLRALFLESEAAASSLSVSEFSLALASVRVCQLATATWFNSGDHSHTGWEVVEDSCVTAYQNENALSDVQARENECDSFSSSNRGQLFTNFMDAASLAANIKIKADVPFGTYRYVQLKFNRYVRFQAQATLADAAITKTIYTRPCGASVCGSVCEEFSNVKDCRGIISGNGLTAGNIGQMNPIGDVWRATPFDALSTNVSGASHTAYWSRCAVDMTTGPSEQVYMKAPNNLETMVLPLPIPLELKEKNYLVPLLSFIVHVENSIVADMKPFVPFGGGISLTNFYGVSDGLYAFNVPALSVTPVAAATGLKNLYMYQYMLRVRKTDAIPVCMSGPVFGKDGVLNGAGSCHPCHSWTGGSCMQGPFVVNDRNYTTSGLQMQNKQDFDVVLSLIYVAQSLSNLTLATPQGGNIGTRYVSGSAVVSEMPFEAFQYEGVSRNSWDNSLNILNSMYNVGPFPRIRDLPVLTDIGQIGSAKVLISVPLPDYNATADVCSDPTFCSNVDVYLQVGVELTNIVPL